MTIESKYNLLDKVWGIYQNKVCEFIVKAFHISSEKKRKTDGIIIDANVIEYRIENDTYTGSIWYEEANLYSTKKELLEAQ